MKILKFIAWLSIPVLIMLNVKSCHEAAQAKKENAFYKSEKLQNKKEIQIEAAIINRKISKQGIETVTINALSNILPVKEVLKSLIVDSIAKTNNIKPKQIVNYTSVSFVSKADYLKAIAQRDSFKNLVYTYRNKWLSVSYTPAKDSIDTTGHFAYQYNTELNQTQYWERYKVLGLKIGRKQAYVNFALVDSNARIQNVKNFVVPYQEPKFGISLQARAVYNITSNRFFTGPGLSLDFNKVNVLAYYYYNVNANRWEYAVGLNKTFLKL
ncbi:hypothetical protein [Pedobacter cryophilus]|uniref:Uncharacterized protein n=1 Tax=Pedobacter cryophilus TaxID=2571271 RepID=A0A4V5NWY2_9SPHI|nr:hypothetical protein [Pedobacter cryophilus]TKB96840.1 hypothetical protein FA046_12230 [Pedobacter cryophilus]